MPTHYTSDANPTNMQTQAGPKKPPAPAPGPTKKKTKK